LTDSANVKSGSTLKWFAANAGDSITANAADTFTRAKVTLAIRNIANVGTHIYTVNLRDRSMAIVASTTYTLTVAAANTDASAATSQLFLNEALPTHNTYYMSDSTLVKSAGQLPTLNLMTPSRVAYLGVNFRNSAGESTVSTTGTAVGGTMVVKITSGPGLLSDSTNVLVRQVSVKLGDTVTVWNDGSSGVTTIVGYIGNAPLAQAAKTMTFYGKATTFTATANAVTARGWNLDYSDTGVAGNDILSFIAKDATGLAVPSPSQNIAQKFYVNTSDTKIVRSTTSATSNFAECTISATATEAAAGKYYCDMYVIDSGTVTLTVMDSETVTKSSYTSNVITVNIAGTAVAGTLGFAKFGATCTPGLTATGTFDPGESVIMCLTAKDGLGRNAGQTSVAGKAHDPFSWSIPNGNVPQDKPFWIGGSAPVNSTGAVSTGTTTLTTINQFLTSSSTFVDGVETVVVYMPTTSGDINIKGATGTTAAATADTYTAVTATLKVTGGAAQAAGDAAAAAAKAAQDAAVAAAEKAAKDAVAAANAATAAAKAAQDAAVAEAAAATDAANEAIDAANAATDAANLAAEAADAATVAAEEARDAADSATAAVEELATQVATLMAAMKAQLTTLANTVAKIAKKVKA
jgi:hypothetical protein